MKIYNLGIAVLVLLALGGFLYWSNHHKPTEDTKISTDSAPAILKLDDNSIIRLNLQKPGSQPVELAKSSSSNLRLCAPIRVRSQEFSRRFRL
jgi:hypothetical protein